MLATFSALADANRLRIVELLRDGPQAVGDIGDSLHLNQPQVSKHLRVLKEAGLVDVEARGQQRLYAIRGESLRAMDLWLDRYRSLWSDRMDLLGDLVTELSTHDDATVKTHKPKSKRRGR